MANTANVSLSISGNTSSIAANIGNNNRNYLRIEGSIQVIDVLKEYFNAANTKTYSASERTKDTEEANPFMQMWNLFRNQKKPNLQNEVSGISGEELKIKIMSKCQLDEFNNIFAQQLSTNI